MLKPFNANDLYRHRSMLALVGSTKHARAIAITSRALEPTDAYRSLAWLVDTRAPGRPKRVTSNQFNVSSPALSPEADRLAFLSVRGDAKGEQVQVLPLVGGEATPLAGTGVVPDLIHMWFPDGTALLVSSKAKWAEDEQDDATLGKTRPVVVDHLPYKMDGSGPTVGHRTHLVRIDVAGGKTTVLASGDFDVKDARLSPDGLHLAFVRTRSGRQRHLLDLWLADADGGNATQLSANLASIGGLSWSPDGTRLAFSGSAVEGDSLSQLWLFVLLDGSFSRPVGDTLQLERDRIVWHADGQRLAIIVTQRGLQQIAVVDLAKGSSLTVCGGLRHVTEVCPLGDRLLFAAATMRIADELYSVGWDGKDERRHSNFNRSWFARRIRPRVTLRRFEVVDGDGKVERIDAWLLRPPGPGPFPLLLDFHGGPQSAALVDYASHVYWYELCSKGWAILAPMSVGSSGYGTQFAYRLRGRWGELDLAQHLSILDALQDEGIADHRVACTGKSYGGFLTAWAVGHSRRFKAAVVSAPVSNLESHAGTSDTGYYVTPFALDGELTQTRTRSHELSPIGCSHRVTTPTLLMQGADDARCPIGQSEELFAELIRNTQAPAKMVLYPGGSHAMAGTGRPSQRLDYHTRLVSWLQRWVP